MPRFLLPLVHSEYCTSTAPVLLSPGQGYLQSRLLVPVGDQPIRKLPSARDDWT